MKQVLIRLCLDRIETTDTRSEMETTIYLATDRGLTVIVGGDGQWRGKVYLEDKQVQCVGADSNKTGFVYCGTFGNGLFTSETGALLGKNQPASLNPM